MTQEYELTVVASGGLTESKLGELVEKIKKLIEAEKSEVTKIEDWGKKDLSYEIKKSPNGYYTLFSFKGNPKTPNVLNSKLNLMEDVLRFLIVREENKKAPTKPKAESS